MSRSVSFRLVRGVVAVYDALLGGLAIIAAAFIGIGAVAVIVDVIVRNLGFHPPPHTLALTEYSLLYVTMLGSPWVLRHGGHIYIDSLIGAVGARARRVMANFSCAASLVACAILFSASLDLTLASFRLGDQDIRSFDMPRWIIFSCLPVSFLFMGIEFARMLPQPTKLYAAGLPHE